MKNLVLYHNHCTDGFMSATLMYLYFKEIHELDVTNFIAVNYNEPIPDVTERHVYIVDFSYHPTELHDVTAVAKSITMLDHHLTAAQQWGGYKKTSYKHHNGCPVFINIEEHKSGAGLVYEWIDNNLTSREKFNTVFSDDGNSRIIEVTQAVQDRDLWNFKFSYTKEIYEALNILPRTFEAWEEFLVTSPYESFREKIKAAGYYLEVKEKLAQEYASKYQMINFLGNKVPIVNCPANFASRVCEIMYKDHPFSVSYCLSTKVIFVSFRSDSVTGMDVSEIAKKFKGGGHRNASGCKISTEWIELFLNGKLEHLTSSL